MRSYSVAEAKNGLPSLIDKARDGEAVVITRHGHPVAELRSLSGRSPQASGKTYDWLAGRRKQRPKTTLTSVELLNILYED